MRKETSKRILSIILASLMVTSAGSVTAFATDPTDGGTGQYKDILSIGPRKVGLAITNIPDFGEYEDLELTDEDGDGIYEGYFENLIIDFPEYSEVSFRLRLDDSWSSCWGVDNADGYTYGSDVPVTVELKEGETLYVRFDTRNEENYRHWKIETSKTLDVHTDYTRLNILSGDPEMDSLRYDLRDDDGDGIFEGDVRADELFGVGFRVQFDYEDNFCWGYDGNGGTAFGSTVPFPDVYKSGEVVHVCFDTTDPDYKNWKISVKTSLEIYETDNGTNLMLHIGDDIDEMTASLTDDDNDGIYTAVFDYADLYLEGAAYAFLDGFTDYRRQSEDEDWEEYYVYSWGSDGQGGTKFGSTMPVTPDAVDGMMVAYYLDTRDDDYHNWTLTTKSYFDLTDPYLFAVGSFSDWAKDQKYMLFDNDEDGIYTTVVEKPGKGDHMFVVSADTNWTAFWRTADASGNTFCDNDNNGKVVEVTVNDDYENLYISFDTNADDYHHWTINAESKVEPYDFSDEIVMAYCDYAEVELKDKDGDGIYTGEMPIEEVYDGDTVTLYYTVSHMNSWWNQPDGHGVTYNNEMPGAEVTVKTGDTVYLTFDTTNGDRRYFKVSASTKAPTAALENNSYLAPDIAYVGDTIQVYGSATGGTAPYTYKYSVVNVQTGKAMDVPEGFVSDSPINVKLTEFGEYDVKVQVKDAQGNMTDDGYLMEAMAYNKPLTNESKVTPTGAAAVPTIELGEKILYTGKASGGTAPYTYSYYYKRHFNNNWKPIKENTTSTSARLTPTVADDYDLKITVKDSEGAEAEAYYMVRVVNALENMSVLSADSIKIGEALTVTGAAQGGSDPYTYSYYVKNVNDKEWTVIHENVYTAATVSARTAGSYEVKVIVTDSRGKTAEKILGFTAKNNTRMINTSVINSNIVQVGDKVRLAASANGGTAPYKFAYYYKRSSNNNWKVLGTEFGTNSSVAFAPTAEADYDVKIIVKDADGETSEKTFTVTAVKELELTNVSTINRNTVNLGSAVKMTAKAVGGTGPYTYAFYFKRATNTIWKTVGTAFTDTATAKIKPTAAADYQFRIVVQDSTGAKATKEFTVKAF